MTENQDVICKLKLVGKQSACQCLTQQCDTLCSAELLDINLSRYFVIIQYPELLIARWAEQAARTLRAFAMDEDGLGPLPGATKPARRKPDPRRQSVALFSAFNKTSAQSGLLVGEEIAVGDEDVQVPLEKSGRLLGLGSNHNHIWLEPGVDELLNNDLPSPDLTSEAFKSLDAGGRRAVMGHAFRPDQRDEPGILRSSNS